MGTPAGFDRYVAEHNIPEEEWPEAFAHWIAEHTGGPVPWFERVEPGDEQILEGRDETFKAFGGTRKEVLDAVAHIRAVFDKRGRNVVRSEAVCGDCREAQLRKAA